MKRFFIFFIVLLLIICLIPAFGTMILGPSTAGANEILAGAPSFLSGNNVNFSVLSDASDWFNDHFAFRQELITLWSQISVKLFRMSPVEKVTAGTDDWLYYTPTLNDYIGNSCSERELFSMVENLSLMQEYTENEGMSFLFTVAPNKNSLYPQNMPLRFSNGHEHSSYSLLLPMMQNAGIHTVDLSQVFLSQDEILYYETDSHWNTKGAAYGADAILTALGISSDYSDGPFSQTISHTGDLYQMLYPSGVQSEPDYEYTRGFDFTTAQNTNDGEAPTIRASNINATGSVYFWRDSFGSSLYSYIAQSFGSSVFTRSADYDLTKASDAGADYLVIELVERNLTNLITKNLIFPSPVRPTPSNSTVCENATFTVDSSSGTLEGLSHITGSIKQETATKSVIYILADGVYYEACITYDENGNEGFSAWVPLPSELEVLVL